MKLTLLGPLRVEFPPRKELSMSLERNPPVHTPWLAGPLTWLVRQSLRRPRIVIAVAVVLAVASMAGSVNWLGFRTNRLDLLNPASEYHQRWLRYMDGF